MNVQASRFPSKKMLPVNRVVKVGLLWHSFRSGNLGVGALSICNIELIEEELRRRGISAEYVVIGNSGPYDYVPEAFLDRVEFVHFSARAFASNPLRIYRKIAGCEIVFDIGEGDSFSDIYGLPRLLKLSFSKLISILHRRVLVLSPQTVGPFNTLVGKYIATYLMRRAHTVVARDHLSRKLLADLGKINAEEGIDVAFRLHYADARPELPSGKIKFGLNVSGLLFHGGYNGKNQFSLKCDYMAFTLRLLEALCENKSIEVHLVPHVLSAGHPIEDDYSVCKQLQESFKEVIVPDRFRSPTEAKSYISLMDIFAGARMHATVAAFSSNVAVLPLAYSRKFGGLFETIGYGRVLDMRSADEYQLVATICKTIAEREELKKEMAVGRKHVQERIDNYKAVVRSAFDSL